MPNITKKRVALQLYTDASKCEDKSTSVSLIVDRHLFYGKVITITDNLNITSAEFLAIIQGLEYIKSLDLNVTKLSIYTDVLPFKLNYQRYLKGEKINSEFDYKRIAELTEGIETNICYFTAHQKDNNLNKSCDILARTHSKLACRGVL